ncbi:MAG: hypothetical protein J6T10_30795 [Methanobrevibacter sp.]|nr:hypothetical protein [Methanobrevibacter sp.]
MAIRYDTKFNNKINRIVKNYNAKIKRLSGKGYDLPSKIAVRTLKQTTRNRADLNRKLKNLMEFTKRGGEKNIMVKGREIPQYRYKQIQRYRGLISRRLTAREEFNKTTKPTYEGKEERYTLYEQFNEESRNIEAQRKMLLDVNYLDYTGTELTDYLEKLESNARTVNLSEWQKNYADMLLESGYVYNIPHAKLHDLREKVLDLSPAQFDKLFKTESTIKQILYYYNQINELGVDVAFENMESDVVSIYESLFENIDDILKDYK